MGALFTCNSEQNHLYLKRITDLQQILEEEDKISPPQNNKQFKVYLASLYKMPVNFLSY